LAVHAGFGSSATVFTGAAFLCEGFLAGCAHPAQLSIATAAQITLVRLIIPTLFLIAYPNYSNVGSYLQLPGFTSRSRPHLGTLVELGVDEDG
jgi:hypothetical protein